MLDSLSLIIYSSIWYESIILEYIVRAGRKVQHGQTKEVGEIKKIEKKSESLKYPDFVPRYHENRPGFESDYEIYSKLFFFSKTK